MSDPLPKWAALVMAVALIIGFTIALWTIENERNARHAEVCTLAIAFLSEQRIAQAPTAVPAGGDPALRAAIVSRNKLRARSLASVESSYVKVCG